MKFYSYFCIAFEATRLGNDSTLVRWVSGLNQQFAKLSYG